MQYLQYLEIEKEQEVRVAVVVKSKRSRINCKNRSSLLK
jgi:hypothetical protein